MTASGLLGSVFGAGFEELDPVGAKTNQAQLIADIVEHFYMQMRHLGRQSGRLEPIKDRGQLWDQTVQAGAQKTVKFPSEGLGVLRRRSVIVTADPQELL
ncbi:hypothetical protein [Mameliella sp.]|uniref:hypothetical protein n=1 Tax=Mameliella sp. TaxID=1924940 RepID=UPI003BA9E10E